MFNQDITKNYNLEDATYEIVIMLLVAFILGYLLRYFLDKKSAGTDHTNETGGPEARTGKTESRLSVKEKAAFKKELTIEYTAQIDELNAKLSIARIDLEQCLASKVGTAPQKNSSNKTLDTSIPNDFKIIEGIGPALAKILIQGGITSFKQLSESTEDSLRLLLSNAGSRFKVHDPSTWPEQARLAVAGNWEELKIYQEEINSGMK